MMRGRVGPALWLAIPIAAGLVLFAESCGSIHGSPKCGALSMPAVALVVLALMLGSALLRFPPSEWALRVLLFVLAYAAAFLSCLFGLWLASRRGR